MAHDVFISYSHKDKAVADAICARLEQGGARCWYAPRDIVPGADWAASIIEAIRTTKVMVLVFTDYANASQQVMREVSNAVSNSVTIVPFKLTESLPTEGMQYYLSTVHWLDALDRPLAQSVERLNGLVQAILAGTTPDAASLAPPPEQPRRELPSWAIGVLSFLAVLLVGGVILAPRILATRSSGDAAAGEGQAAEESSGDVALQAVAVPASGSADIQDPDNTGTRGNLLGNYQNSGYAASDGEWFYFRAGDGFLWKMRLDGSERTQLNEEQSSYIGVIDGYVYYYGSSSAGTEGIRRMPTDGGQATTIYTGMLEDMMVVGERVYFKNSLDGLKLYSVALEGGDVRCEGDVTGLYYLTIWDGLMYWANDEDGRCLYRANLDGSDATKLTDSAVDSITVADGWIMYNDLGDYHLHMLEAATLEDHRLTLSGIYDPVISSWGIVGQDPANSLHLCRTDLGGSAVNPIVDVRADNMSVCEGYVFFTNEDDGNVYMVDIYGDNLTQL